MIDSKLQTHKVATIPHRLWPVSEGEYELQFLVHLPKPKESPDKLGYAKSGKTLEAEAKDMFWGVARGTVGYEDKSSAGNRDITSIDELVTLNLASIEDHWVTAQREAFEELGITPTYINESSVKDHGIMIYAPQTRLPYPLHIYSFALQAAPVAAFKDMAQDSQDIAWKSLGEIKKMAYSEPATNPNDRFKAGYVDILEQVAREISASREQHKSGQHR